MNTATGDVCIVEDDDAVRDSLAFLLDVEDISVSRFESAEQFLESGAETAASCLVLDYQLGGMSGADLIRNLRRRQLQIPIIMISGQADSTDVEEVQSNDDVVYLRKPCNPRLFVKHVRQAIAGDD